MIPSAEGNLAGSYTTTYDDDPVGALTSVTHPAIADLPGETINYTTDSDGRFKTVSGSFFNSVSTTTYYDDGKRNMLWLAGNGALPAVNTANSYGAATGRLARVSAMELTHPGLFLLDSCQGSGVDETGSTPVQTPVGCWVVWVMCWCWLG